jgi:hypothetical protein
VNWEACMDSATRVWTSGVLIRDYERQVLAAKCMHALSPPSGAHLKLYVCVQVLCFALEMGFLDIICEGPTIQSLMALKFCPMGPTIEDSWLKEIWFLIQKFRRCTFSCISSDSNQGAWILAQFGSTLNDLRI